MKAKILGRVITRSERTARFLNRHFEMLAWMFFVVFLAALVMFVRGLFLFYTTGSCNGANSTGFAFLIPPVRIPEPPAPQVVPARCPPTLPEPS